MINRTQNGPQLNRPTQTIEGKSKNKVDVTLTVVRKHATKYTDVFNKNKSIIESYDTFYPKIKSDKSYSKIIVQIIISNIKRTESEIHSIVIENGSSFVIVPTKSDIFDDSEQGAQRIYEKNPITHTLDLKQNEYLIEVGEIKYL
jgi:hypothetical protein